MKSIFDMTDEELEQLSELKNTIITTSGYIVHMLSFLLYSRISLNELQAVKRLINHEIEYLAQKENKDVGDE